MTLGPPPAGDTCAPRGGRGRGRLLGSAPVASASAYLHMRRLDIYNFSSASSKLLMS